VSFVATRQGCGHSPGISGQGVALAATVFNLGLACNCLMNFTGTPSLCTVAVWLGVLFMLCRLTTTTL
jgi:hypothetical protein